MWFGVSVLFRSIHMPASPREAIWEESIVVIEAASADEARELAASVGRSRQVSYLAAAGNSVYWKFESIGDVFEIDAELLSTGVEVFSRHMTESELRKLGQPLQDE